MLASQFAIGSLFAAEDGLLLYYPCDEGSGTVLKDHGPLKKDGKLNSEPNGEAKGVTIVCEKSGEWVPILTSDGVQRKNITKGSDSALAEGERPIVLDRDKDYEIDYEGGRIKAIEGGRVELGKPFTLDFKYSNPGPTWVEGKKGKGLKLDGVDDFFTIASVDTHSFPTITLQLWLTISKNCQEEVVLVQGTKPENSLGLFLMKDYLISILPVFSDSAFHAKTPLIRERWQLVTVTCDKKHARLFCNEAEIGYGLLVNKLNLEGTLRIGGVAGIVDEIKIYNRAKTAEEIAKDAAQ